MPFMTVNGRKLNYADTHPSEEKGSTKKTIIFVHGLGSSQNYYFPILPYLTDYRCITLDTYGAGRSKFDGQKHSIETIAKDVLGVLDTLKVDKAIIVGYSMGGMIPTQLAATASDRVLSGICIGPVNPSPAVAEVFKKRVPAVREGGMEAMANTIPYAATGSKSTALQKAFIREMLMAQEVEGYVANCQAIQQATPPSYVDVHVPILIIAGDEDKSAPLAGCQFILESLSSKQKIIEVLQGVGHWHCVEASDEVGKLVADFCGQLR